MTKTQIKRSSGRRKKDTRNLWGFNLLIIIMTVFIVSAGAVAGSVFIGGYIFDFKLEKHHQVTQGIVLGDAYERMRSALPSMETVVTRGEKVGKFTKDGVLYTLKFTSPKYGEKVWQVTYRNYLKNISNEALEAKLASLYGLPTSTDCQNNISCEYTFFLPFTLVTVTAHRIDADVMLGITATDLYYSSKRQ